MLLLRLPLPVVQIPEIKQAEQHLPEPDFSLLCRRRVSYRARRYSRPMGPRSRCLTRLV